MAKKLTRSLGQWMILALVVFIVLFNLGSVEINLLILSVRLPLALLLVLVYLAGTFGPPWWRGKLPW